MMGSPMTVTIELDALYIDDNGTTLADLIIREAGRQALEQVEKEAKQEVGMNVRSITREQITLAVTPLIAEAIGGSVQLTNALGESRGEPVTLRKAIVDEATKQLRDASANSRSDRKRTVVQEFIQQEVTRSIQEDLKKVMDEARAEVKAAVTEQAAEMITSAAARLR
jgi:hypothetical protein